MMLQIPPSAIALAIALAPVLAGLARPASASAIQDYIALGDSVAFGETDFTHNPSYGDRGYVKPFADYLGTLNNGVRPQVFNLAVDGETTGTFFHGGTRFVDPSLLNGKSSTQWNLNYPNATTTQNQLLQSTIASEQAHGHAIGTVSVQLGANDLYQVVSQAGFFTLTPQQQQAEIGAALVGLATNYTALMAELKTELPHANILLLGYYNPFNADPSSPIGQVADPAIKALNKVIADEAKAFGAKYVNTYSPFLGNELAYTYIATGNVHPNGTGYQVIAEQMEQLIQPVPEPASLLVFAAGLTGGIVFVRRGRKIAA